MFPGSPSYVGLGAPNTWPSYAALLGILAGSWIVAGAAGTLKLVSIQEARTASASPTLFRSWEPKVLR